MSGGYDPKAYWNARLLEHGGLKGTGHISFGEKYNQWLYRAKQRTLLRALEGVPLRDKQVLDVGCGNGYFIDWYHNHGARLVGVDISTRSIEQLQQRYPGDFRVLDISAVGTEPLGLFDIVNVWDVLYHVVDDAAFERALRFIGASLRSGGLLLISDRLGAAADARIAEHVRMRGLATYQRILSSCGLELVSQQFLYSWLNRYVLLPPMDNHLGGFYYWLDGRRTSIPADNLSLGVWRRSA